MKTPAANSQRRTQWLIFMICSLLQNESHVADESAWRFTIMDVNDNRSITYIMGDETMGDLKVGAMAPEFTAVTESGDNGGVARLSRQARRALLLSEGRHAWLHNAGLRLPRQLPGDRGEERRRAGVSPDSARSHTKFKTKFNLPFTLLVDEDHTIAAAYGVWTEKSMFGKKYMGIERSHFVIDEEGRIVEARVKVKPDESVASALAALG
jgi:peroxiredoxin Q/BCP